jgi:hypothetical protein
LAALRAARDARDARILGYVGAFDDDRVAGTLRYRGLRAVLFHGRDSGAAVLGALGRIEVIRGKIHYNVIARQESNVTPRAVTSDDVNAYLRQISREDLTPKDFRT